MVGGVTFLEWFQRIQRLSNIKRCSFYFCHWPESVAEHSFFCSLLAYVIANQLRLPYEESLTVSFKALIHDIFEADVGDISWNVELAVHDQLSQFYNSVSQEIDQSIELDELGKQILEFVDKAELFLNLYREYLASNGNVLPILVKAMELLDGLVTPELQKSQTVSDIMSLVRMLQQEL